MKEIEIPTFCFVDLTWEELKSKIELGGVKDSDLISFIYISSLDTELTITKNLKNEWKIVGS